MIEADELKQVPIFACLTDAQRIRFAHTAAELHVQEGEWLIREGEAPWFFILLEGALDVEKEYGGLSEVRSRYRPGDFFGEIPILLDSPAIASLRASAPSRVMRLDRMQFKELIDSSPECSSLIVHVMAKRVSMIREHVQDNNPVRVLVLGSQYDDACRDIRSFLSLNRIPYRWADRDREPDQIPACVSPEMNGPSVVIDESKCVGQPLTVRKVAEALGIQTIPTKSQYDVVIVGGGPAGLAAAVYGASEGLSVLLVEKTAAGGQAGSSSRIENYLGFPAGISGEDLSSRAAKQATRFGAEMVLTRRVERITPSTKGYSVELDGATQAETRSVILATGVDWRKLEAAGIERLLGKGVLYGAARAESPTIINKDVFIVGGGNSAGQAAMFFSGYAASVTLLVRGSAVERSMSHYLIEQIAQRRNISVRTHTQIVSANGDDRLESIHTRTEGENPVRRQADALFVMIGAHAETNWLPAELQRDENGFVCTGSDLRSWPHERPPFLLETNLQGVFCAGDVRHDSIKRVSSGVGEGSMCIAFVHQYLALQN
jgi:thioredoxin reductase (NADPH)